MKKLSKDTLVYGGFAGLREHRIVTDSRVFGPRKLPETEEGLGSFVYLADARFNPKGETGMHPHKELDVISVMVEGLISHQGSLEHGQSLVAGEAQVQRAGGEGFAHNEINPDDTKNRMLQIWALPETAGEPAGYKLYPLENNKRTRIYGGSKEQSDTFDSHTLIDIVRLGAGGSLNIEKETIAYLYSGQANFINGAEEMEAKDGDLVRTHQATVAALVDTDVVIITQVTHH